jgi:tetratricopeptide (TPR) repeat protein
MMSDGCERQPIERQVAGMSPWPAPDGLRPSLTQAKAALLTFAWLSLLWLPGFAEELVPSWNVYTLPIRLRIICSPAVALAEWILSCMTGALLVFGLSRGWRRYNGVLTAAALTALVYLVIEPMAEAAGAYMVLSRGDSGTIHLGTAGGYEITGESFFNEVLLPSWWRLLLTAGASTGMFVLLLRAIRRRDGSLLEALRESNPAQDIRQLWSAAFATRIRAVLVAGGIAAACLSLFALYPRWVVTRASWRIDSGEYGDTCSEGHLGSAGALAIPTIRRLLENANGGHQAAHKAMNASAALARMHRSGIPYVRSCLQGEWGQAALQSCVEAASTALFPEYLESFVHLIGRSDLEPRTFRSVAGAVARLPGGTTKILARVGEESDPERLVSLVSALSNALDPPPLDEGLLQYLSSPDPRLRYSALQAIAGSEDPDAVEAILRQWPTDPRAAANAFRVHVYLVAYGLPEPEDALQARGFLRALGAASPVDRTQLRNAAMRAAGCFVEDSMDEAKHSATVLGCLTAHCPPSKLTQEEALPNWFLWAAESILKRRAGWCIVEDPEPAEWVCRGTREQTCLDEWSLKLLLDNPQGFGSRRHNSATLRQALSARPNDPAITYWLGVAYFDEDKPERGLEAMRQVLKLDRNHVDALNWIGWSHAERGENIEEAERLLSRAVELRPDDAKVVDSLGWVYFQRREYPRAIETLTRACTLAPQRAVHFEHLGDALAAAGEAERALGAYREALARLEERAGPDVSRIEGKLARLQKQ